MRRNFTRLAALTLPMLFAFAGVAQAQTLGITAPPAGATPEFCFAQDVFIQASNDPSTPYTVPGPGHITQWQTNTTGATAGSDVTFVVVRSNGDGSGTVVGSDSETLPNPLPTDGTASYTLATPIAVTGGETLGLWTSATSGGPICFFDGGSTPTSDSIEGLGPSASAPAPGDTDAPDAGTSPPSFTMNVAATFAPAPYDAAVTASASPTASAPGQYALLASTVSNNGPGTEPVTFTDTVPTGLTIKSAFIGSGSCTTSGQTVTCTSGGLSAGSSTPVNILVTPSTAGQFVNTASVAVVSSSTDTNPANNTASATLNVTAPAPPRCTVPHVKGAPSGVAKSALRSLGCRWRVVMAHSTTFKKGHVIRTRPGAGVYAHGRKITLVVSSGPKKTKKAKKHHPNHAVRREPRWR